MVSPVPPEPADYIYEFGPFRLVTAERLLLRGDDPVSLTPKAFDTLLVLVHNGGRLVRKDALIKQLWPDAVVEEANLARNVWAVRKALGDGDEHQAFIETIPKIGYRFIAPVTVRPATAALVALQADPSPPLLLNSEDKEQIRDAPHVPATRRRLPVWMFGAACVATTAIMAFWPAPKTSAEGDAGLTFLTDGSHDDSAASWTQDGRIYFSRAVTDTRLETWTIDPGGTTPRRANTTITNLLAGRWSPDGRRVVFTKDGDLRATYMADADGAHEVVLPFMPGNLDWSPDGSQIVYQAKTAGGTFAIGLYVVATGKVVTLSNQAASDADPSFSPDGGRVAFTSWRDGNAEIYVMAVDGSRVQRITNHPAFDNYPVFSPDGTQIAFQSNREDEHVEIYLQNLDTATPPVRLTRSDTLTGILPKCWSPDGTRMLVYRSRGGKFRVATLNVDPYPARLLLSDADADLSFPRVSADGRNLLHEARLSDGSVELRVKNLETKDTRRLYRTHAAYPVDVSLSPAWSPDNTLIAFSVKAGGDSEIFSIASDGTGLRNLTQSPLLDMSPVFSADGREIFFARDAFGQAQLYRMDTNGGRQRRITTVAGYEMSPASSPDGVHLAFAGDRDGHGLDVFLLDLRQPLSPALLASRRSHETSLAYSPDGTRLTFVANSDGNPEIYVMNVNGTGLVRLTHSAEPETWPQFFKDSQHILFGRKHGEKSALYQIDVR